MKKKQATSLPVRRLHCNESGDVCHAKRCSSCLATRCSSCLATRCSSCLATARCRARLGDSRFLEQRPHSPPASSITRCRSSPANTKPNSTSTRVVFKERVQILKAAGIKKRTFVFPTTAAATAHSPGRLTAWRRHLYRILASA